MSETSRTLPLRVAARIAYRETRASATRFLFVVLAVAVGVGALTGVRAFSQAFRSELMLRARSILAADASASLSRQLTPAETAGMAGLEGGRVRTTQVTSTVSMVSSEQDQNPLLVTLKIVDPTAYPFYGSVNLLDGRPLRSVLTDGTVVVGQDLLIRLSTKVGSQLQIGSQHYRIADVVTGEPDALVENFAIGPRVLMTRHDADAAGLLQPGTRATQRWLFQLPAGVTLAQLRADMRTLLPEAEFADYRETNPTIRDAVDRSSTVLSLVSLVALVLGSIAVAMAMHAHLQQRLDNIAVMKSLGATSSHILRIYVLQTLLLGTAGGLLGVVLGFGIEHLLPVLVTRFLPIHPALGVSLSAMLTGFVTGLLTTQLFTLPALLGVRRVKPSHVLRRNMDESAESGSSVKPKWWSREALTRRAPSIAAAAVMLLPLAGIAAVLTDSARTGFWFAGGLAVALLGLLGISALLLRVLRRVIAVAGLRLPPTLRHGLANLYRPGNQTSTVLTALGLGVMLSVTVLLVERSLVRDFQSTAPFDLPNVYLIDISPTEIDGVRQLLQSLPGRQGDVTTIPAIAARLESVNGAPPVERRLPGEGHVRRDRHTVSLSWSVKQPDGLTVKQGKWFGPDEQGNVVSVSEWVAKHFDLKLGSTITFRVAGKPFTATVTSLHDYNSLRAGSRSEFLLPQHALAGMPAIWYGAAHFDKDKVSNVQRAMFAAYPTVTVVNLADALQIVQTVVANITRSIEFLAGFCIFSAAVLLASSVAGTRFRRIREIVVLKTLGATRLRIGAVLSTEFLLLGALGGAVGMVFAQLLARILVHRMEIPYHPQLALTGLAVVCAALLAAGAGWAACFRILGQKPLGVLREE